MAPWTTGKTIRGTQEWREELREGGQELGRKEMEQSLTRRKREGGEPEKENERDESPYPGLVSLACIPAQPPPSSSARLLDWEKGNFWARTMYMSVLMTKASANYMRRLSRSSCSGVSPHLKAAQAEWCWKMT